MSTIIVFMYLGLQYKWNQLSWNSFRYGTWGIIKRIINKSPSNSMRSMIKSNNRMITDDTEIANVFNEFFASVGPDLAKHIPETGKSPTEYIKNSTINSIVLENVTEKELFNVINSLKISAAGHDEIGSKHIKISCSFILKPLLHICNMSFTHGVFPGDLKIAKVIPRFKSGDHLKVNNYRPVSILPVLSKVLEKLMYNRLMAFIEKFKILYDFQFGVRKAHSTALIYVYDQILKALQNESYSIGVYLDFSKAFDTINHDILFQKLQCYGVRGIALEWIKSYMSNRYQYVSFNSCDSCIKPIECGVPQGSILGPLLFFCYMLMI